MQALGAIAIICSILSIFSVIFELNSLGLSFFITSLILFLGSIISSLIEILLSTRALNILLSGLEESR
jgi:hypothetical protein